MNYKAASSWNVTKTNHASVRNLREVSIDPLTNQGYVLKVNYPVGSYKPSAEIAGGMGADCSPQGIFPARSVRLSYEVFFPSDFNPVKGGKLPGFFLGPSGANGGRHVINEASCRIMWRRNNARVDGTFMAEAYVYAASTQHPSFYQIPGIVVAPIDGTSLWRGLVNFNKGEWNKIDILLTANTVTSGIPDANGYLNLTINKVSKSFDKMIFTATASPVTGVNFVTFFGGSEDSWATPVPTSTYFKNVKLLKIA